MPTKSIIFKTSAKPNLRRRLFFDFLLRPLAHKILFLGRSKLRRPSQYEWRDSEIDVGGRVNSENKSSWTSRLVSHQCLSDRLDESLDHFATFLKRLDCLSRWVVSDRTLCARRRTMLRDIFRDGSDQSFKIRALRLRHRRRSNKQHRINLWSACLYPRLSR